MIGAGIMNVEEIFANSKKGVFMAIEILEVEDKR
jgi:hypothetical protein